MQGKDGTQNEYGDKEGKSVAYAIATQQAHAVKKSPKGFKTPTGVRVAKRKYSDPKAMKKTAAKRPYTWLDADALDLQSQLEERVKTLSTPLKVGDKSPSTVFAAGRTPVQQKALSAIGMTRTQKHPKGGYLYTKKIEKAASVAGLGMAWTVLGGSQPVMKTASVVPTNSVGCQDDARLQLARLVRNEMMLTKMAFTLPQRMDVSRPQPTVSTTLTPAPQPSEGGSMLNIKNTTPKKAGGSMSTKYSPSHSVAVGPTQVGGTAKNTPPPVART